MLLRFILVLCMHGKILPFAMVFTCMFQLEPKYPFDHFDVYDTLCGIHCLNAHVLYRIRHCQKLINIYIYIYIYTYTHTHIYIYICIHSCAAVGVR
jgi:hypothetical protein